MPNRSWEETTTAYLKEDLREHCSLAILRRGFDYYNKRRVREWIHDPDGTIHAQVRGSGHEVYLVDMDLNFFSTSTCTCPYDGYCKHIAAVAFRFMAGAGFPPELAMREFEQESRREEAEALAAEARRRAREMKARQEMASTRQDGRAAGKPATSGSTKPAHSAQSAGELRAADLPSAWKEDVERWLSAFGLRDEYGFSRMSSLFQKKQYPPTRFKDPLAQQLYELFALTAVLERAEPLLLASSYVNTTSFTSLVSRTCFHQLAELLNTLDATSIHQSFPLHLRAWMDRIGEHLTALGDRIAVDWLNLYRLGWERLAGASQSAEWLAAEEERLQHVIQLQQASLHDRETAAESGAEWVAQADKPASVVEEWAMCGWIHLDYLRERDQEALARFGQLRKTLNPALWSYYWDTLVLGEQWDRLLPWLCATAATLRYQAHYLVLDRYYESWNLLLDHRPAWAEWTETMISLIPHSYEHFSDRLLRDEQYADWADLAVAISLDISSLDRQDLKIVEKKAPAAILPLYHQHVEICIQQRKRPSYKEAVKYLKRLNQCYKKLKQPERFAQYVQQLLQRHARLRAFQEELVKGKIIS